MNTTRRFEADLRVTWSDSHARNPDEAEARIEENLIPAMRRHWPTADIEVLFASYTPEEEALDET